MELKKISQEELNRAIELHKKWLNNEEDGIRLDLNYYDFSLTDFSFADLRDVYLKDTTLYETNLFYAKIDNMIGLNNIGKYNRTVYYFYKDDRVICGCFDDTLEEFEKAVREKYGFDNKDYNNCIELFKKYRD